MGSRALACGVAAGMLLGCTSLDGRTPGLVASDELGDGGSLASATSPGDSGVSPSRPDDVAAQSGGGRLNAGFPPVDPAPPAGVPEAVGGVLEIATTALDFGAVLVGAPVGLNLALKNVGDAPLVYTATFPESGASAFSITRPCSDPLAPARSCVLGLTFLSTTPGDFAAELLLTASGRPPLVVPLSASALAPDSLRGNEATVEFGAIEAGVGSVSFTWVLTNVGSSPMGPLILESEAAPPFSITQNGCGASLAPGDTCSLLVRFAPTFAGLYYQNLLISDGVRRVPLSLSGIGQHRLTVTRSGTGSISSDPAGLACTGNTCTGLFDPGSVTLTARTDNGSGSFFTGWSGRDCRAQQECSFYLQNAAQLTATFAPLTNNLIFTSSTLQPPDLGGLAAYDAECNRLASSAGINDADGDAFIAAMSASNNSLRQRLAGARGWVRMDGLPFGDTIQGIFDDIAVHYSVNYDERGVLTPLGENYLGPDLGLYPWTGTLPDGSASPNNCNDWTARSAAAAAEIARVGGGPLAWINYTRVACSGPLGSQRILCMGRSRAAPISVPNFSGKRMWTVFDYTPGSMPPDEKCQSDRPPGVGNSKALVTYSDLPAAAVLRADETYVRTDGALIGTGADIARQLVLGAPWLDATARFDPTQPFVWTGGTNVGANFSDQVAHCDDWRSTSSESVGLTGNYGMGDPSWFYSSGRAPCNVAGGLYCVEQ